MIQNKLRTRRGAKNHLKGFLITAAVLFVTGNVGFAQTPGKSGEKTFRDSSNRQATENVFDGKMNLDIRVRYEHAGQDGLKDSNANTFRTRLGYETLPWHSFKGRVEFEDNRIIGDEGNANFPGSLGDPGRTIVADPEVTELNRMWLSYEGFDSALKLGRQKIVFDKGRFIGNVGWRQNEQTYDAVSIVNKGLPDTSFTYAYVQHVNRIFGNGEDVSPAQKDFDSNSHLFDVSHQILPSSKITFYAHFLDLNNTGNDPSSNTFGGSLVGSYGLLQDRLKIRYRAEYAFQEDAADNPIDYDANYYNLAWGGSYDVFEAGMGYEVLGSDDRVIGLTTPLATLHAFNGYSDAFLTTPPDGLKDFSVWASVKLPYDIPFKVIYHKFGAEEGDADFGYEIDSVVSKKLGKYVVLLLKYADYESDDPRIVDQKKFWTQIQLRY